jgi:predicted DNA-binding transcriptional regulator
LNRDKAIGVALMAIGIIVILFYAVALFAPQYIMAGIDELLIKITVFIAVAAVMGILAWIGYTLATTPPPKPIEEIEKELEEELKKLEKELEKEKSEAQGKPEGGKQQSQG